MVPEKAALLLAQFARIETAEGVRDGLLRQGIQGQVLVPESPTLVRTLEAFGVLPADLRWLTERWRAGTVLLAISWPAGPAQDVVREALWAAHAGSQIYLAG